MAGQGEDTIGTAWAEQGFLTNSNGSAQLRDEQQSNGVARNRMAMAKHGPTTTGIGLLRTYILKGEFYYGYTEG